MTEPAKLDAFLAKASKQVEWGKSYLEEMRGFGSQGRVSEFERVLAACLATLDSLHDFLLAGARLKKEAAWRFELERLRESDPLLRYLWKARNSELHDVVVKWLPDMRLLRLKILDQAVHEFVSIALESKYPPNSSLRPVASLLFLYDANTIDELTRKLKGGARPSPSAIAHLGAELEFTLDSFSLNEFTVNFKGKSVRVQEPSLHLGRPVAPDAYNVIDIAFNFYSRKLDELRAL